MTLTMRNLLGAAVLFASAANAHISMSEPVPYGKPDTSPLVASGANYPCKTDNGFKINTVTPLKAGAGTKYTMTFSGSASHGGGSCQVSLTKGFSPTADSSFKVVTSIEGGCPGGDNGGTTPATYTIPAEVPNGNYSLAWTWFNKIGNREMYMNCAPVTITGGASDDSGFNKLPDMAVYNIASKNTCKTIESKNVKFTDPGSNLQAGADNTLQAPDGCGGAASAAPASAPATGAGTGTSGNTGSGTGTGSANTGQYTGVGAGSGTSKPSSAASAAPAAASSAVAVPSQAAPAPAPAPAGSGSGTFAEGSSAGNQTSGTSSSGTTSSSGSASSGTYGNAPSSGTTGTTSGAACPQDGSLVCSPDGTQFGLCNWGKVLFQAVAAGTKCQSGQIMKRQAFYG